MCSVAEGAQDVGALDLPIGHSGVVEDRTSLSGGAALATTGRSWSLSNSPSVSKSPAHRFPQRARPAWENRYSESLRPPCATSASTWRSSAACLRLRGSDRIRLGQSKSVTMTNNVRSRTVLRKGLGKVEIQRSHSMLQSGGVPTRMHGFGAGAGLRRCGTHCGRPR
jgi:hypothetical protein